MKKLIIAVIMVSISLSVGCSTSKQVDEVKDEYITEDSMATEVLSNTTSPEENVVTTQSIQINEAEKVIQNLFEATKNQDINKAKQYVLYDDLRYPYISVEDFLYSFQDITLTKLLKVEKISTDLEVYNFESSTQENMNFVVKKVDDKWYVALSGVLSRYKSTLNDEQVKDGKIGIYLRDIYTEFNGKDCYFVNIVNNTSEEFTYGYVKPASLIYETKDGKKYVDFDSRITINPYENNYIWFYVDSSASPVKSIILKEVMQGSKASTSEVGVLIGEMINE